MSPRRRLGVKALGAVSTVAHLALLMYSIRLYAMVLSWRNYASGGKVGTTEVGVDWGPIAQ